MSLRIEFLSGADSDLQDIFNQYEQYRDGFGGEFMAVIEAYLIRIAAFPEIAPIYVETIRRQVIRRSPYGVFYEPHPTRIVIVAIIDLRQDASQILRHLRR